MSLSTFSTADCQPDIDTLRAAAALVRQVLPPTPQISWPLLNQRSRTEVWVKQENHQPVGAFKIRGGLLFLHHFLQEQPPPKGFISATRGNHGQSLAFAARRHGVPLTIVVPHGNSPEKNAAMRALGAHVITFGNDFTAAAEHAMDRAAQDHLVAIPSFHPWLILGVASYWLEFFQALPDLHTVYVPLGLGSGLCAGLAVRRALGLSTELVGVVASHAPAYAHGFASGIPEAHPVTPTVADGIAVRQPHPLALELIRQGAARIVTVSESAIETAMKAYFIDTHNVAEGAAAAPLAALLQDQAATSEGMHPPDRKVGLIHTGGNVDHDVLARILQQDTPNSPT